MTVTTKLSLLSQGLVGAVGTATNASKGATLYDPGSNAHDTRTAVPGEETAGNRNRADVTNVTSGLSPVTQLSGVLELQEIMAGSVPDATPPSQNVLGSPPKRNIAINPVRPKSCMHGAPAGDDAHEAQVGVAIPTKGDF